MSIRGSLSRAAAAALVAGSLMLSGASAVAADHRSLTRLAELAAQRVLIGDKVAAAKFGTDQPIDDPVREQQILESVAARATDLGMDSEATVRFFRAQIEANKIVQRGLYALWTAHPELQPTIRPDLVTEVRPELDRITIQVLTELQGTEEIRAETLECRVHLLLAEITAVLKHHLDALHRQAFTSALVTVCTGTGGSRG
jgi:chorismate mutase